MASEMEFQFFSDGKMADLSFIHGYGSFQTTTDSETGLAIKALWLDGAKRFLNGEIDFALGVKKEGLEYRIDKYDTLPNLYFLLKINGVQFDFNLNKEEVKEFMIWLEA